MRYRWTAVLPLFLITFATSASWAQDDDGLVPMEPKHIARLRSVTATEISPDGSRVAYTVSVPRQPIDEKDGPAWSELHVVADDGTSRPFIIGEVSIGHPQWSADGKWIYYTAKRGGDEETVVYRIAVDGGESIRTLKHSTAIEGFDLSPDGKRIAFIAKEERDKQNKELREKGFDQQIYEEDWRRSHVWITTIDPQATQLDSKTEPRKLELDGSASMAKWSPSGKELMVVLAPTPSIDDSYMHKRVHVLESETGRRILSVNNPGKLGDVVWSPDGKRLAMVSGRDIHDPREGRLMVVGIDGNEKLHELMPGREVHVRSIAWKDDSNLYWLSADGVSSQLGEVNLGGESSVHLPSGGPTVFTSFSLADAGQIALVGHAAAHPGELFVADDVAGPPLRASDVNPWLTKIRLAKQTAIRWQARDGLEIEGVLVYPLDYVEGRRYPTIMYVHGGPESHESNGWLTSYTRPGQVAAARGFAVFYPNYRGSTGRGVEFSMMGQRDAAGSEFDDLVDGVDHLIKLGVTDKDSVGVTGGSYGGYASAWCSTFYSERFAASVMFVGIADNVSKVGTTDIPEEMFLVHHRMRLWDDWEYFLQRSPIRYVQRNQTPTLILHGKNDPRVHPSQSLELHRHLKTLGKAPVRLVLYEGEGHGNRKAASRLDYNLRMLRWMQHFLQNENDAAPVIDLDYRAALGLPKEE